MKPGIPDKHLRKGRYARRNLRTGQRTLVFLAANSSYAHTNLAEWYLCSSTADLGWRWKTVELVVGEEPYPALNHILALKPDVVAASLYVFNRDCVMSILRRLKAAMPACRVVVGGPELLGDNRTLLERERCIDAAVRGEGETAFREWLRQIDSPAGWRTIKGLCGFIAPSRSGKGSSVKCGRDGRLQTDAEGLRCVDGAYMDNGFAEEVARLDDIPSPYKASVAQAVKRHKPFVQLETSRGCRNSCAFCTSGRNGSVRYFSPDRVRSDLRAIRAAGAGSVRVVDRTFNDNARRCVEMLRMFREEFGEMDFHLEIDPAKAGPAVLEQLAAARCGQFHIDAGLQSFSGAVLRTCNRRGGAAKTAAGLEKLCALKGVAVHADLIAGLPGQTLGQAFDDVRKLVALKPAEIQLELLKLLPGTRLADEAGERGIVASPAAQYEVIRTPHMSEEDIFTAHWLAKLVDWFYGAEQLRDVVQQANAEIGGAQLLEDPSEGPTRRWALRYHRNGGTASVPSGSLEGLWGVPGFWPALCGFCRGRAGLWMKPSLANRFALLKEFFERQGETGLVHAVQYAWMKHGLGPGGGICETKAWKKDIPGGATLVEGDAEAEVSTWQMAECGHPYLFGYGAGRCREAVVVCKIVPTSA